MSYSKFEDIVIKPLEVEVVNGNFEEAFRRFKSLVQKEKIVTQYKERMAYEKPSEKKRRKKREALERQFLIQNREQQILSGEWERRLKRKEIKRRQKQEADSKSSGENSNE